MRNPVTDASDTSRKLGLTAAVAVVLGNIVGVMIFLTPAQVARFLPWDGWFMAAWALGGLLALLGALCLGELGAMLPEAGGDYVYIREAFGDTLSFLSGWTSVVMTFPGSIAAMAVGLCFFQGPAVFGPAVQTNALYLDFGGSYFAVSWAQVMGLGVIFLPHGREPPGPRPDRAGSRPPSPSRRRACSSRPSWPPSSSRPRARSPRPSCPSQAAPGSASSRRWCPSSSPTRAGM